MGPAGRAGIRSRGARYQGSWFHLCTAACLGPASHRGSCSALSAPFCLCFAQLLAAQRVSCTHIYSALDQTARKINLARFTHGKCSALIVTDLAARGLDIPLLDNVINYSFPAKGKLFLHRVGKETSCSVPWAPCRVSCPPAPSSQDVSPTVSAFDFPSSFFFFFSF